METYHAHQALSSTRIKAFHKSPAHYRALLEEEKKETDALRFGRIAHAALLEPRRFLENYKIAPKVDRRTKAGKEEYENFLQTCGAHTIILKDEDAENIVGMVKALQAHPIASALLQKGLTEKSLYFEVDGVEGKARPDQIHEDGFLTDVKTTLDASYDAFRRQIWNLRYDIQAAWYTDAYRRVFEKKAESFTWIAIEKVAPWGIGVFVASDGLLTRGRDDYSRVVERYKKCVADDKWPCYPEMAQEMDLPAYATVLE